MTISRTFPCRSRAKKAPLSYKVKSLDASWIFLIEDASASNHIRVVLFCFDFVFYMVWIEILIGFFHDWWFDKLIFITSKYIHVEQTNWTWGKLCKQYIKLRLSFHFLLNDFTLQLVRPTSHLVTCEIVKRKQSLHEELFGR